MEALREPAVLELLNLYQAVNVDTTNVKHARLYVNVLAEWKVVMGRDMDPPPLMLCIDGKVSVNF